jgi:hypothetical protein
MTTMDLDRMRSEWAARDAKLQESLRVNTWLLGETWLDKHQVKLRRADPAFYFELAVSVAVLALLGIFIANHVHQMRFLIPALALDAWTLVMLVVGIRDRAALADLDYGMPLVAVQSQLEKIRMARMRHFKWAFLTGQIVWWIPLVIVLFRGLLGVDLYAVSDFMPRFMAYNVAGGLAFIPLAMWLSKRYGAILQRLPGLKRIADSIAGRDVADARQYLEKLQRFEKETA